jgi:hypothetical protein
VASVVHATSPIMALDWMSSMHSMSAWGPLLAAVFVVAGALWMGTLFSVSWLSGCARLMADGPEIGRLALTLFRRWTIPSLCASVVAGLGWLAVARVARTPTHWAYAIAALAVPLVALQVGVGRRARRIAQGSVEATRGEAARRLALMLSMGAVIALTFRSTLLP